MLPNASRDAVVRYIHPLSSSAPSTDSGQEVRQPGTAASQGTLVIKCEEAEDSITVAPDLQGTKAPMHPDGARATSATSGIVPERGHSAVTGETNSGEEKEITRTDGLRIAAQHHPGAKFHADADVGTMQLDVLARQAEAARIGTPEELRGKAALGLVRRPSSAPTLSASPAAAITHDGDVHELASTSALDLLPVSQGGRQTAPPHCLDGASAVGGQPVTGVAGVSSADPLPSRYAHDGSGHLLRTSQTHPAAHTPGGQYRPLSKSLSSGTVFQDGYR